jgi:hypothetical protein
MRGSKRVDSLLGAHVAGRGANEKSIWVRSGRACDWVGVPNGYIGLRQL